MLQLCISLSQNDPFSFSKCVTGKSLYDNLTLSVQFGKYLVIMFLVISVRYLIQLIIFVYLEKLKLTLLQKFSVINTVDSQRQRTATKLF